MNKKIYTIAFDVFPSLLLTIMITTPLSFLISVITGNPIAFIVGAIFAGSILVCLIFLLIAYIVYTVLNW